MSDRQIRLIVTAALFAAMTCAATLIMLPVPNGYLNLGDALVLLCGYILGPVYGAAAAGIGSALSDLMLGYAVYAPGTLVIKALMAALCAAVFRRLRGARPALAPAAAGLCGEAVMVCGYFLYTYVIFADWTAAVLSLPWNLLQAAFGLVLSVILTVVLMKIPYVREAMELAERKK